MNPQPGQWAHHVSKELDPRQVTRAEGSSVYLRILNREAGPFPAENYTYSDE